MTKTVQMKIAFDKAVIVNHFTEWLKPYSKFNSVEELDRHYEKAMADIKHKFTKVQHDILFCVRQHACVVPGVANKRYKKYLIYFEEKMGYKVSKDTFQKAIDKAERYGLLLKVEGRRLHNKSQAANVIIFNRFEEVKAYRAAAEAKEREELERLLAEEYEANKQMMNWPHEAKAIATAKNHKKQNQEQEPKQTIEPQKPQTLYQKMRNLYKPASDSSQKRFRELVAIAYGSLKRYKNKINMNHNQLETVILNAFKTMLAKNNVQNQAAMFSVIIKNQLNNLIAPRQNNENTARNVENVPDWFRKYKAESEAREEQRRLEEEKNRAVRGQIDYEKERERILKKLEISIN